MTPRQHNIKAHSHHFPFQTLKLTMVFQVTGATNLLLALEQRSRTLPILPIDIFLAEEIQRPLSRRPRRMLE